LLIFSVIWVFALSTFSVSSETLRVPLGLEEKTQYFAPPMHPPVTCRFVTTGPELIPNAYASPLGYMSNIPVAKQAKDRVGNRGTSMWTSP
jgi:hypothetical protein